jgi:hypothetical protein
MNNYILYLIGPAITFSAGFYFYFKRQKLVKGGNKADGEVVELQNKGGDRYPIIKFKTLTGETVVRKYKVSQGSKMRVGQQVQLYYNADKPSDFMIDSVSEKWAPLLLIAISIVFLIMFFIFLPVRK